MSAKRNRVVSENRAATERRKPEHPKRDKDGVVDYTEAGRRKRKRAEDRAKTKQAPKPKQRTIESARDTRRDLNKQIAEGFNRKAKKIREADDTRPTLTLADLGLDPDAVEGQNAVELNPGDDQADEQARKREQRRRETKELLERLSEDAS